MKFFTNKVRYGILAGFAVYGAYHLVFDFVRLGMMLQNCNSSPGTSYAICYVFGLG